MLFKVKYLIDLEIMARPQGGELLQENDKFCQLEKQLINGLRKNKENYLKAR
jgi:hypothetical protein